MRPGNEVIVPSTDPGQLIVPIERVYYTPCPSNAHTVIVKALAFRIRAVARHQDAEGLPYAALDSRSLQDSFHRYMGFMIKTVNAGLAEAPKRPVPGVFVKIHALLAIEVSPLFPVLFHRGYSFRLSPCFLDRLIMLCVCADVVDPALYIIRMRASTYRRLHSSPATPRRHT